MSSRYLQGTPKKADGSGCPPTRRRTRTRARAPRTRRRPPASTRRERCRPHTEGRCRWGRHLHRERLHARALLGRWLSRHSARATREAPNSGPKTLRSLQCCCLFQQLHHWHTQSRAADLRVSAWSRHQWGHCCPAQQAEARTTGPRQTCHRRGRREQRTRPLKGAKARLVHRDGHR
jgi:hypothetical protein